MKRKLFSGLFVPVLMTVLCTMGVLPLQAQVSQWTGEFGKWESPTTTLGYYSFNHNYNEKGYAQTLYLPSEVGGREGWIQEIQLYKTFTADVVYDSFKVYMANSTVATPLATPVNVNQWVPTADLVEVWSTTQIEAGTGEFTITLDRPFHYDGTSNLAVVVVSDRATTGTLNSAKWGYTSAYTSTTSEYRLLYKSATTTRPTTTGTRAYYNAMMRFFLTSDSAATFDHSCTPASAPTVTQLDDDLISIAVNRVDGANYEVQIAAITESNPNPQFDSLLADPLVGTTHTFSGLNPRTRYRIFVHTVCSSPTEPASVEAVTLALPATLPYNCNFDDALEASNWEFKNFGNDSINFWHIGSAPYGTGSTNNAIYISNNKTTYAHEHSGTALHVLAGRRISVAQGGWYDYSYDWMNNAGSTHHFHVVMVPAETWHTYSGGTGTLTGFTTTAVPAACISLDGTITPRYNVNQWKHEQYTVYVPAGEYYLAVFNYSTTTVSNPPVAIDNLVIDEAACAPADSVVVTLSETDPTEAELSVYGSANYYLLKYWNSETADTVVTDISTTATLTGLVPGSLYGGMVYALCTADTSLLATPFSIRTECITQELPFSYGAEVAWEGPTTATYPYCWAATNGGNTTYKWQRNTSATYVYSGAGSIQFYGTYLTSASYNHNDWLITPVMSFTGNDELVFKIRSSSTNTTSTYHGRFAIYTNQTTDASCTADSCFTRLGLSGEGIVANRVEIVGSDWETYTIALPDTLIGDRRLAFVVDSQSYTFYIDNLQIRTVNNCVTPADLRVVATGSGSVTLQWVDTNNVAAYDVSYKAVGSNDDPDVESFSASSLTISNDTVSAEVTGLTERTTYTFQVRTACGGNNASYWSDAVEATTTCLPLPADTVLVESFDGYANGTSGGFPDCWTRGHNSGSNYPYVYAVANNKSFRSQATYFYSGTATAYNYMALPAFQSDLASMQLNFNLMSYSSNGNTYTSAVEVGLMGDPTQYETFVPYDTIWASRPGEWDEVTIDLSRYNTATDGQFVAFVCRKMGTFTYNGFYIDNVRVQPQASCAVPAITSIVRDTNGFTVRWNGDATLSYDVYATRRIGDCVDTLVPMASTLSGTEATLTGLVPGTEYEVTVVGTCGMTRLVSLPKIAWTLCGVIDSLPYYQDFEGLTSGASGTVPCWTLTTRGSQAALVYPYSTSPAVGSMSLYFSANHSNTNHTNLWATLPRIDTAINRLSLSFVMKNKSSASEKSILHVGVMTDPNDTTTFDTIRTFDMSDLAINTVQTCEVMFNSYTGQGRYIAFLAPYPARPTTTATYNRLKIDSVVVDFLPACVKPDAVEVSALGSDSLVVSWQGSAAGYELQYSDNANFDNAQTVSTTSTEARIGQLQSFTRYFVRVRTVCSADDMSDWSIPVSGRTRINCGEDYTDTTLHIGNGTTTSYYPFAYNYSTYGDTRTFTIVPRDSLAKARWQDRQNYIRAISVSVAAARNEAGNVKIYMAETDKQAFASTADSVSLASMQLVYSDTALLFTPGINEIALDTAFAYSGTRNLLICVARPYTWSATTPTNTFHYTSTTSNLTLYTYHISATSTTWSASTSKYLPNLRVLMCKHISPCPMVDDLAVDSVSATQGFVTWNGSSERYAVAVGNRQISDLEGDTLCMRDTVSGTTYAVNSNEGMYHYVYVKALCGDLSSDWSAPVSYLAPCAPRQLPFYENFESYATGSAAAFNSCWRKGTNYTTTPYPYVAATNGTQALYMYATSSYYSYAALPMMADSLKNLNVAFSILKTSVTATYGRIQLGVMTDAEDVNSFTTLLDTTITASLTNTWVNIDFSLANYTGPEGFIAFRTPATASNYTYLDNIEVYVRPACATRMDIAQIDTITGYEATVKWPAVDGATKYLVEYGAAGFTLGTGIRHETTLTRDSISGLYPGTDYEAYVTYLCSATDTAHWSYASPFSTLCAPVPLPIRYDPEDYATGTAVDAPNCWTRWNDGSGTGTSNTYINVPYIYASARETHTGTKVLYFTVGTTASYHNDYRVLFHEIDTTINPIDSVEVSFWAKSSVAGYKLEIGVQGDIPESYFCVDSVELSTVQTHYSVNTLSYTGHEANRIVMRTVKGAATHNIFVDDINMVAVTPCPRLTGLGARWATADSVNLYWTDTAGAASYVLEYTKDEPEAVWTRVGTTSTSVTIHGLTPNTQYRFRVASVCTDGDTSGWSTDEPAFTTSQRPATVPYFYDFEDPIEWENWQQACNLATAGWYRGIVAEHNNTNHAYVSFDGGATHGWHSAIVNLVTWRDIDFGPDTADFIVTYNAAFGGTMDHDYDGLNFILADPTQPVISSTVNITSPWGHVNDVALHTTRRDTTWGLKRIALNHIAGVQRVAFYHMNQSTGTTGVVPYPSAFDNLRIEQAPCQGSARNMRSMVLSSSRVDLEWEGDTTGYYLLEYKVVGSADTDYTMLAVEPGATSWSGTNFQPGTNYYWWLRHVCDSVNYTAWSSTHQFTTPCLGISVADTLHEGFETVEATNKQQGNDARYMYNLPACWSSVYYTTVRPHVVGGSASYVYWREGNQALGITGGTDGFYYAGGNYPGGAVRLPQILESTNTLVMKVWYCFENSYGYLDFGYFANEDSDPGEDFVVVKRIYPNGDMLHSGNGLQSARGVYDTISFRNRGIPDGNFNIGIRYVVPNQPKASVCIDDISIWSVAPCTQPIVSVDSVSGDAIALRIDNGYNYEVVYGTEVDYMPNTVQNDNDSNIVLITGLEASTLYYYSVRNRCDDTSFSPWTIAADVRTLDPPCEAPTHVTVSDIDYTTATVSWQNHGPAARWALHLYGEATDRYDTVETTSFTYTDLFHSSNFNVAVSAVCEGESGLDAEPVPFSTRWCDTVTGIELYDGTLTDTSAVITWNAGSAYEWTVEYGYSGFSQSQGTIVVVNQPTFRLENLEELVEYDVYVRANCADGVVSRYAQPFTFRTAEHTGIADVTAGTFINLYPNPATSTVTVSWGREAQQVNVDVVDMNGRTVLSTTSASDHATLDISSLAQGAYFVRLTGEGMSAVSKLIVR